MFLEMVGATVVGVMVAWGIGSAVVVVAGGIAYKHRTRIKAWLDAHTR